MFYLSFTQRPSFYRIGVVVLNIISTFSTTIVVTEEKSNWPYWHRPATWHKRATKIQHNQIVKKAFKPYQVCECIECILVSGERSYRQWRHSSLFHTWMPSYLAKSLWRHYSKLSHTPPTDKHTHPKPSSGAEGIQTNILTEDLIRSKEREKEILTN